MEPTLISPPVPADADLRDFAFMPLDVARLRDSGIAVYASAEEFRAAVILWCVAWHQIPAGSLPDDDRALAALAGFGRGPSAVADWAQVRDGALRGFQRATDGRLYHIVVVEKVLEAWERKQAAAGHRAANAEKLRRWRERKQEVRNLDVTGYNTVVRNPDVTSMTGTGTGTGTTNNSFDQPAAPLDAVDAIPDAAGDAVDAKPRYPDAFEEWWSSYPRRVGKGAAFKAWQRAVKLLGKGGSAALLDKTRAFALSVSGRDQQYIAHPATWLNQWRWDDAPPEATPVSGRSAFGVGG